MTTISRPPHIHQHSGPIHRGIDSGPLAPMPNERVYEPIRVTPDLTTRPIPPPPPQPMPTYALFVALRIGSATRKPFTITTDAPAVSLTYDPTQRWFTASVIINETFWHTQLERLAREQGRNFSPVGPQDMVLDAMLRIFPSLELAPWAVTLV